jgi:hypothetical protein
VLASWRFNMAETSGTAKDPKRLIESIALCC